MRASFLSSTDFKSKILLVSRALSLAKTVTTSTASKPAGICPVSAVVATTISKPTQPQDTPLLVP